ncbi:MAG: helix-turn-helix transcriptional regulator [Clostridia bacterium]|nr:helix-turn-helix transcriptional regulator [Clostridia bacterium]
MKYIYTPYVLQFMRFKHEFNIESSVRKVMDYEFDFCVNCDREMWIDGKNYQLEQGCFVIRKPGQLAHSNGIFDCYMLTLDFSNRPVSESYSRNTAAQMQEPFDSLIWDVLPSVFKPLHYDSYIKIFEQLLSVNEMNINENAKTGLLINELLHLVIADAYSYYLPSDTKSETPINEVCSYIKNHFAEKITLEDLAGIAHLNKNHLVRQFKKVYGISPISYLIKFRLDYAKKLLAESNLPIKTVAAHCGYSDPSFFTSYFKTIFHISPAEYRRSQQTNTQ